ncbi:DNA-directed RNA polymerase specialized sigma24 family protein [Streptosporangium becharense]|uniref:DNA-directed RNA polymerase specialized sigma24 family protein n=1 Tax=Streptosporangium becharense TaxID=1816182 RepID=A0A7W9IK74_9ACTN|nr:sigma-70 family RNA polymerase sigma factor [Streptosporangium becharense]MBB2911146.1 DNA-directed RNA polymerase specialized sigma24 family protein [Streptosporangium becharense]MBB5821796.1 DNA-directed RNA polymerase specialized sigma24 family protein [Streptosporangium becharense]
MPGWPAVGRTDDQQLVAALRRADVTAPAGLYDFYAERLNDYAYSLLGDRDAAAEAVHDALVTARDHVDRLREPARLRAWLYALTRFRCGTGTRGPRGPEPGLGPDAYGDPGERELAALVHETLAELAAREREILELALRHGLGAGEVGTVVGLGSRQVAARLGRARDHLENAAGAVVLARVGRAHCPELSAMVDSWEGPLSPALRGRLAAHIGRCEVCVERRNLHVPAGRLLDLVPIAFPPLSLRRRVIETCLTPDPRGTRAAGGTVRLDRAGFPPVMGSRTRGRPVRETAVLPARRGRRGRGPIVADDRAVLPAPRGRRRADEGSAPETAVLPAPRGRRRARRGPVVLAAVCVLAATGAAAVVGGRELAGGERGDLRGAPGTGTAPTALESGLGRDPSPRPPAGPDPDPGTDPDPNPAPGMDPDPDRGVGTGADPAAGPAPDPAPTRGRPLDPPASVPTATARPSARPSVRPTATRRPGTARPRPTRETTPAPATGRLTVSCPPEIGEDAGRIRLTASGTPISWSATASAGLEVRPRSGRLKAGASGVIWVTATDPTEGGAGRVAFRSAGGDPSCAIRWESPAPEASDPPEDPPPEPDPTLSAAPGTEADES